MSGHDRGVTRRQIALDDVQIGAADTAGVNLDEDFARLQRAQAAVFERQAIGGNRSRLAQDGGNVRRAHSGVLWQARSAFSPSEYRPFVTGFAGCEEIA